MANTILITANWHTGALSQQTISRQYDNNRYVVQFVGYPEASEGNELDYYLLVWMSSAPGETPDEIAPIQLASDQWYISNVFTQQTQQIKFQMCALNTAGTFEAHSPIFTGFVRNSLEHDGAIQDIDVSTLFDAYREYLNELIIRAGAVVIDPTLSQSGQAADAKVVGDEINSIRENTKNLFSIKWFLANNITINNGVAIGTANAFFSAFRHDNGGMKLNCKANTVYTFSGKLKTDGDVASTGNGMLFRIYYTDSTYSQVIFSNTWTDDYHEFVLTSDTNKTIDHLAVSFYSAGGNTWYLTNMQLEEGTVKTKYVEFYSAVDSVARSEIEASKNAAENAQNASEFVKTLLNVKLLWEYGTTSGVGKNIASSQNMRTCNIIHVKKGSTIKKTLNTIAVTVIRYSNNDLNSFLSSQQILPLAKMDEYVFEEDTYCRFIIQNPSGLSHSPSWANTVVESNIYDADFTNHETGVEIAVLGFSSYLGNAIVFKLPNGIVFGIDSYIEAAYNSVKAIYTGIGVSHFDYFMITHYHRDHVGNIVNLISDGYIDENTIMILPPDLDTSYATPIFTDWLDELGPKNMYLSVRPAITERGCEIIHPTEGQVISISGVDFSFFNCDHSIYYPGGTYASTNFNDLSIGCYVTVGNYNFCDTADLGPIAQQRMVDLNTMRKANIYTATHHGWDNGKAANYYGLIPAWINRLSPDVVISEDYSGHDSHLMSKSAPMQSWCEANGIPNYRSRVNGTMYIALNKHGWQFKGNYSRFIRNDKNWSYSDNSEHVEE